MGKVAVVNRTNFKNYGSVLQCYALCEAIKELGYNAEIIWETGNLSPNFDFRFGKILKSILKLLTHPSLIKETLSNVNDMNSRVISEETVRLFEQFVEEHITQTLYSHKALVARAKQSDYTKFVCGSDQIWCSTTLYPDPLMYLRFAPRDKRVAYAPSIGREFIPDYNRKQMKRYIQDIPQVSVREDVGRDLLCDLIEREVPVVTDPTFLLSLEKWEHLRIPCKWDKPYLLCYFLDTPNEEMQTAIAGLAQARGVWIIALGSRLPITEEQVDVHYPDAGPGEFLGYIKEADAVYTDSYHGMLFSLIYQKQFWSIARNYQQYDQSSRQRTVLKRLGLEARYVEQSKDITEQVIDHSLYTQVLEAWIADSKKYLKQALIEEKR